MILISAMIITFEVVLLIITIYVIICFLSYPSVASAPVSTFSVMTSSAGAASTAG